MDGDSELGKATAKKWAELAQHSPKSQRDWRWLTFLIESTSALDDTVGRKADVADGRFLVAMGEAAIVYDVATGRDVFRTDFPSSCGQAAITPDGGLVAVSTGRPLYGGDPLAGPRRAPVRLFELPTGIERPSIIPDSDWVDGLIFDGDGGSLVTLGRGNSDMRRLSVWSLSENYEQLPLGHGKKLAGPLARTRN